MRHRTALIGAMALTAFVLIIVAGVITRLTSAPPAAVPASNPQVAPEVSPAALDPQNAAAYQQALQTANARLAEANRQLEQAYERLTPASGTSGPDAQPATSAQPGAAPNNPPSQPAAQPSNQITAEEATRVALAYAGGGTVTRVRLEEEHGQLIYEVRFSNGSRVYVDPQSGRVVYARLDDDDKGGDD